MTPDLPTTRVPNGLECGALLEPTGEGGLTVTGRFPHEVVAGEQTVAGTVEVAAGRQEVRGVVTPQADVFLVRDGRIVTLPVPQDAVGMRVDLADGRVERMPATATLAPCSGARALERGSYQLYVRVVLNHDDGSETDSTGGPWPLEVR